MKGERKRERSTDSGEGRWGGRRRLDGEGKRERSKSEVVRGEGRRILKSERRKERSQHFGV